MRVLINAVAARMGGAATHLPNFLRIAGRRRPRDEFVACVNAQWALTDLPPNIRVVQTGHLRNRLAHAAWDLWGISRLAVRERADVMISLLNFGPVGGPVPQVVLERNPVYFCDDYLRTLRGPTALEVAATRALAHAVMRGARRIITPSAAMREMIRAFYPDLPLEKFRVVHHGFGIEEFRTPASLAPDVQAALAAAEGTRLLYVSHAASYKGIEILLEASRLLRDREVLCTTWLTIDPRDWPAGVERYQAFIREHRLAGRVVILGRIPHAAVHHVYGAADLFVYPSLCESFGFPQVEAMASGLPIVAADRPLCREICGGAAVYYPPRDAAAMADVISSLRGDEPRRRELTRAGGVQAQRFSWNDHVDAVLAVAEEAATSKS